MIESHTGYVPSRSLALRLVLFLAHVTFVSCGGDAAPAAPTSTARDSAGVRIVENRWSDLPAPGIRVASEPMLLLGAIIGDPAHEFTRVTGATRLSDGRIAVADAGVSEVRVFDAAGGHVVTYGRKGGGPQEFEDLRMGGVLPGDTLVLFDSARRWVTLLHPDGGFGRSFTVGSEMGDFAVAVGLIGSDALAFGGGMSFSSDQGFPTGRVRPGSIYGTTRMDGSAGVSLGRLPAAEMWAETDGSNFSARLLPFGRTTATATGRGRFFVGTNESWEIAAYDGDGALREIIRADRAERPVTDELREGYVASRLADTEDEDAQRAIRARYRDMPFAEVVPHYELIRVDGQGRLWVREGTVPDQAEAGWAVFDAEGRLLGQVVLPTDVHPLEIGTDYLLARAVDELGVQTVELYALTAGD